MNLVVRRRVAQRCGSRWYSPYNLAKVSQIEASDDDFLEPAQPRPAVHMFKLWRIRLLRSLPPVGSVGLVSL